VLCDIVTLLLVREVDVATARADNEADSVWLGRLVDVESRVRDLANAEAMRLLDDDVWSL